MTTKHTETFYARCFISNPGGAYDPAPLHEFDNERGDEFIPAVGDIIRADQSAESYRVVSRFCDYSLRRCAIFVEPCIDLWPDTLNA